MDHDSETGALARGAIMRWRKSERLRLIDERLKLSSGQRRLHAAAIARHLSIALGDVHGRTVGVYWPFRGEPESSSVDGTASCARRAGARCPSLSNDMRRSCFALGGRAPRWPRGIWNIPVPTDGIAGRPDIVVSPVVGFDATCYRLGYGGGFYDRTLAAMARKPLVIGVGFAISSVATHSSAAA
jgi:5-formyltetrahydrofolate cyclo-ligase